MANTTLGNERGGSFIWREQVRREVTIDLLWMACAGAGLLGDPLVRQRLARSWIDAEMFRLYSARTLARVGRGEEIGPESSLVRLFWAASSQRLYETACNILGPEAIFMDDDWGRRGLLSTRANSIMGGTSEIRRNVIAERILGLPREPTVTTATA